MHKPSADGSLLVEAEHIRLPNGSQTTFNRTSLVGEREAYAVRSQDSVESEPLTRRAARKAIGGHHLKEEVARMVDVNDVLD